MRNLKEFAKVYQRWEISGLSMKYFCSNEVINETRFYYWQKKLKRTLA